ncbi:hypothetical protein [Microcoleus phage My-WqHQDG]|nr:hypothetical protein [Microcoleus phage My-WqHQDG]
MVFVGWVMNISSAITNGWDITHELLSSITFPLGMTAPGVRSIKPVRRLAVILMLLMVFICLCSHCSVTRIVRHGISVVDGSPRFLIRLLLIDIVLIREALLDRGCCSPPVYIMV